MNPMRGDQHIQLVVQYDRNGDPGSFNEVFQKDVRINDLLRLHRIAFESFRFLIGTSIREVASS